MWKNVIPILYFLSVPCVAVGSIGFGHVVSGVIQSFSWSRPVHLGMFMVVCVVSIPVYMFISKSICKVVGVRHSFIKNHILCCAILYVFALVMAFGILAIGLHQLDILLAYLVLAFQCTVLAIVCNFMVLFLLSRKSLTKQ